MNFLKKIFKKEIQYESKNRLEELLELAADNEAFRPDFYRQIFHFKLFVIGKSGEGDSVQFLNTRVDGFDFAYAYTSLSALEYAISKKNSELPYLEIDSLNFFEILISSKLGLILNADMNFGKVFNPEEVIDIAKGGNSGFEQRVLEKGAEIELGIPAEIPDHLIKALNKFVLKNNNTIKDIYFALKAEGNELSYIAAIDFQENCDSKIEDIVNDITITLKEVGCERPLDMTIANDFHRETYRRGGMISCGDS